MTYNMHGRNQVPFGQCADQGYVGLTICSPGYFCDFQDIYKNQCILVQFVAGGGSVASIATSSTAQAVSSLLGTSLNTTPQVAVFLEQLEIHEFNHWGNIAAKYKNQSKVVFGLMNEPHDAKRRSTTQIILLPRNDWTSAQTFESDGSGPALSTVTDSDGSFTNLGFDVHKYLDSGTHIECVDSYISTAFAPLAQWLRCNGRQALLAIAYLNANSDASYVLAETPTLTDGVGVDTQLVTQCLVPH
ncbi:uncharacterized protein PAC_03056 [Phialocephala subalpina]|uniref:cellulase n=1 Tax=Phialocephala subalpina TaxID=576137 RepID=A0A1L7WK68_9HELO|nr:uncharacterized protein PAC_03056 [Phialocephala subalpina]